MLLLLTFAVGFGDGAGWFADAGAGRHLCGHAADVGGGADACGAFGAEGGFEGAAIDLLLECGLIDLFVDGGRGCLRFVRG